MVIIWCDVSFVNPNEYEPMTEEFNKTTTATIEKPPDSIGMQILDEGREELRSNHVPLVTVATTDDAEREIKEHKKDKIFIICSGSVGRYLVPKFVSKYSYIHDFYIYTHNILLHRDWTEPYEAMIQMFTFHTNLLLRLTRDIGYHFIEQGRMFLSINAPDDALTLFNHAQKLEIVANEREKRLSNWDKKQSKPPPPDFRDHLDLLEGEQGLIARAEKALRGQEFSLETSEVEVLY